MDDTKLNTATSAVTTAVSSTNSLIDTLTGTAKAAAVSQPAGGAANALTQMVAAQKATISRENRGAYGANAAESLAPHDIDTTSACSAA